MIVNMIRRKGHAVLVEWVDELGYLQRSVMPHGTVMQVDGKVHCDNPNEGVPYGADWYTLLVEDGMPEEAALRVTNALHRSGIWTVEDMTAHPQDVTNAFRELYVIDAQRLREAARQRQKET